MTDTTQQASPLKQSLLTALLALTFGFLGAAIWSYAGLADNRTRSYLIENPSILQDVAEALAAEDARERLASVRDELYTPFPGAIMGNPEGSKVLVEFTDYNCPYCAASFRDVAQLVAADPELKVIMREWPIFEGSEMAARMALAAAKQGRYQEFHAALFERGDTSEAGITAAAEAIGLDLDRARQDAMSDEVSVELVRNLTFAQSLGFSGTPAFVTGDILMPGAVGAERLKEALAEAEASTSAS
ncbi:DsbA family protein [Erythrobacter sp. SCSIO 43205]|uniref:DsbA family protein n=1 Tax=Erythrobacter sp. SCSIO 43205 TaxID=2779361 RepID=UPI001CA7BD6D|nr:DsbA family protein [Erythrobacter sp. SCSIO 43205]UAB78415.1 DsbA family protein [Erythrobacter sp. SCSIO 43205]